MTNGEIETLARKLGSAQKDMLLRACATNGGGLNGFSENRRVFNSLYKKGLLQGKKGQQYCIVHTRPGLLVCRHLEKQQ